MDKLKRFGFIVLGLTGVVVTILLYYVAIAPIFLLFK